MNRAKSATPLHAAVILAAGASARLGEPKQLLDAGGESRVRRTAKLALATGPIEVVVVLGHQAGRVASELADLPVLCVTCPDPDAGMSASLRAGLTAVPSAAQGLLVLLCDQPALDQAHLERLVAAWHALPNRAAASAYAGVLGVPAILPRRWFKDLKILEGDQGARRLLKRRRKTVSAVANEALSQDIDTPQDRAP